MIHKPLDCVVLTRNFPSHNLHEGDLGVVIETYEPDGLEVEFVTASGATKAVVSLSTGDVRAVRSDEMVTVRSG